MDFTSRFNPRRGLALQHLEGRFARLAGTNPASGLSNSEGSRLS